MKKLMLGNEAVARGAYEAGAVVASAYPGTPSTEITQFIAQYGEIYAEWAPNEKVAAETVVGASMYGGRAICAMKHVGLNVAADPLFTASYTGVNGGMVVCVADDMGMHSSQNEQDSRHYAKAAKIPMLEPSDSSECKEYVKMAFGLSEEFDTPVFIRLSTRISHSRGLVETCERESRPLKPYEKNAEKFVMVPQYARARHVLVEERQMKLAAWAEQTGINSVEDNKAKIGVISSGIAYQYAREALGVSASYLKLGAVYPLPENKIKDFCDSVGVCYVIEELDSVIEDHCKRIGLDVKGKELFSLTGEYAPNEIRRVVLGGKGPDIIKVSETLPGRPPVMCPGCSHRGVFYVLRQMKLTVTGDIGCYTLGSAPPLSAMDSTVCMGAAIGMAHGIEKAAGREAAKKTVAVIGDSTFIHSGITGLIDVAYNKGTTTTIILDNSTTGMTGHQHHPGTGYTIRNEETVKVDLLKLCESIGIRRTVVANPLDLNNLRKIIETELAADEPSVIIARRPCAMLKNVKRGLPYKVDKKLCKDCGLCMGAGCPAISRVDGGVAIDGDRCAGCACCAQICRFGAIIPEGEGSLA